MNIAVISRMDWTHPNAGGAEEYLRNVLIRLADDHDITLYCSNGPDLSREETLSGIEIHRCGLSTDRAPYLNQSAIAARYKLDRPNEDVLLVNGATQLYPLLKSDDRVDIYHLFSGRDGIDGGLKSYVKYALEWISMRLPKGTQIAVSETLQDRIEQETPQSIDHIVPGGVDVDKFDTDHERFEYPTMLHLGRLGHQKGTDRAIEIHREVQERMDKDVHFHIAGTGEMDALAEEYASESEFVTYHGYVSEEKKVELMQRSWVFLMPSRSESFGLVVLEANAAGTPVVASDIEGLSDSIEDGVNGYRRLELGMAVKCKEILGSDEIRASLSTSAREYARGYSWENCANDVKELLQR